MAACYEELRGQALAPSFSREDHGFALLLYQGMAAWIKAWVKFKPKRKILRSATPPKEIRFSSESRFEMVRLLVSMALGS